MHHNFLQWYVAEQKLRSEALARNILDKINLLEMTRVAYTCFDRDIQQNLQPIVLQLLPSII